MGAPQPSQPDATTALVPAGTVPMRALLQQLAQQRRGDANGALEGAAVGAQLRAAGVSSLLACLPNTSTPAVWGDADDARAPMTHSQLRGFVQSLDLPRLGIQPGVRVGAIVTNGPENAVLLLALMSCACVVPINSAGSLEEFVAEITATGVELLVVDDADAQRLAALCALASDLAMPLLVLSKDEAMAGAFKLSHAFHVMATYDDSLATLPPPPPAVLVRAGGSGAEHADAARGGSSSPDLPAMKVVIGDNGSLTGGAASAHDTAGVKDADSAFVAVGSGGSKDAAQRSRPSAAVADPEAPAPPRRTFTRFVSFGRTATFTGLPPAADDEPGSPLGSPLGSPGKRGATPASRGSPDGSAFLQQHSHSGAADDSSVFAAAPLPGGASGAGQPVSPRSPGSPSAGAAPGAGLSKLRSMRQALSMRASLRPGGPLAVLSSGGPSGAFGAVAARGGAGLPGSGSGLRLNGLQDEVLILQTSGSTGSKKAVPYTLEAVLVGSLCIGASCELSPSDRGISQMPLYHAGGIMRCVLAPALAGSGVVYCAMFDATSFWSSVEARAVTWYYASPTMHMAILDEREGLDEPARATQQPVLDRVRLIANAAGPLLPATAEALQATFKGAVILPSYGMTECMPISAPPATYRLERPGSSGQPLGPRLRIADEQGGELPRGTVGEITLQGAPLFKGYDGAPDATAAAFNADGWFKTGDLGYQDGDGYLFITGRSKDVINRGGEIISPIEVENAVMQMPGVKGAAAFPAPHALLQEAVGLVLVPADAAAAPLLPDVTAFVSGLLHPSKWPFMIVYMDDLPKGPTGKVVRTGLAKRLGLPELSDATPAAQRHWAATAPGPGTPITAPIPAAPAPWAEERLAAAAAAAAAAGGGGRLPATRLEATCCELVALVLGKKAAEVGPEDDFFLIGGDSRAAGALANKVRPKFMVACTSLDIFSNRSPAELAAFLLARKPSLADEGWTDPPSPAGLGSRRSGSASSGLAGKLSSLLSMRRSGSTGGAGGSGAGRDPSKLLHIVLLQAVPLVLLIPMRRIAAWSCFFALWFLIGNAFLTHIGPGGSRPLWALVLAVIATRFARKLVLPWLGIAAKWLIIGRYKPGRWPLWGSYYMRWWFVDKILMLTGRGFFEWTPGLMRTYFRMMGAKVGPRAAISGGAQLREHDLLTLGEGCVIDGSAYIRPFYAEDGHMVLKPIRLGKDTVVCVHGVVAPGTTLPDGTGLSPNACSLEPLARADDVRRFCAVDLPGPPMWLQLMVGYPILIATGIIYVLPIFLLLMTALPAMRTHFYFFYTWQDVVMWLVDPAKIAIYLLAAVCYGGICPFLYIATVILIKRTIIGKFKPGKRGGSPWQLFRHWLMAMLLPNGNLGGTLNIMGHHWTPISWIYRALGARVGERIFWPGGGLQGVVEFDCLTIEDDVVFGSRSHYFMSDAEEVAPITLKAGANVADRCTLLPGATVGRNACLGTGGVLAKHQYLEAGAVAVGTQNGSAVVITPGSKDAETAPTLKPFGAAQYLRQATYWLPGPGWWFGLNWCVSVAESVFTRSKMIVTWVIAHRLLGFPAHQGSGLALGHFCGTVLGIYIIMNLAYNLFSLLVVCIGAKWAIIGRRRAGDQDYLDDNYCAKWNIYISLMAFRGHLLDTLGGSAWMVWYFKALGCKIGRGVCLYPSGADPMMNEPELVEIGPHTCINHAFVVNHINTKGSFSLQPIKIGARATLRAFARLMAGGVMEDRAIMLEHTLTLPGETVDAGMAWQGWPVNTVVPVKVLRLQEEQAEQAEAEAAEAAPSQRGGQAHGAALSPTASHAEARPGLGSPLASVPSGAFAAAAAQPGAFSTGASAGEAGAGALASQLGSMRLRKSLRISTRLSTYTACQLAAHLGSVEASALAAAPGSAALGPPAHSLAPMTSIMEH